MTLFLIFVRLIHHSKSNTGNEIGTSNSRISKNANENEVFCTKEDSASDIKQMFSSSKVNFIEYILLVEIHPHSHVLKFIFENPP